MYLFLTSSPCNDDVPAGVDLPCIFFECNSFVENLRACVPPEARLVVVAADPDNYDLNDEMTETFAACFEYHGMELASAELCDARTENRVDEMISGADVVVLGGGHVPTENRFFERIGLKWLLKDFGGVVMGISAGSMNCASIVYAQPECEGESIDPGYRRFLPGLGLTDVMVLPHYQKVCNYILDGKRLYEDITYADSIGRQFIAMPDGSYVFAAEGKTMVFGKAYCIADGKKRTICEDGEYCILE